MLKSARFDWMKNKNKNVLIYNILYKTLIGGKLLHIRFNIC